MLRGVVPCVFVFSRVKMCVRRAPGRVECGTCVCFPCYVASTAGRLRRAACMRNGTGVLRYDTPWPPKSKHLGCIAEACGSRDDCIVARSVVGRCRVAQR